jgi:uncharacterized protein YpbB
VCVEYISIHEKIFLYSMGEDGEASAKEDLVAQQNDEVVLEATEGENGKRIRDIKRRLTRQPSEPGHGR